MIPLNSRLYELLFIGVQDSHKTGISFNDRRKIYDMIKQRLLS